MRSRASKVYFKFFMMIHLIGFQYYLYSQSIKMEYSDGIYYIPCEINGLKLKFIFDTGATNVTISLTEALFMLKNGYLKVENIKGSTYHQIANGDVIEGTSITLDEIKIGNKSLRNVSASITHDLGAPLLLGQSALSRLGNFKMDYSNSTLTFGESLSRAQTYPSVVKTHHNIVKTKKLGKMRKTADFEGEIIEYIPANREVIVLDCENNYLLIQYGQKTGFLSSVYLEYSLDIEKLKQKCY